MKNIDPRVMTYLKVFGERNTGTNFVCKLVSANSNLISLDHSSSPVSIDRLARIMNDKPLLTRLMPLSRRLIFNRLLDQERKDNFPFDFGWKHAVVDDKRLRTSPKFASTLFIFLVRNPWRFVSALHKRPYNILPNPPHNLSDFVESSFLANERDCLPSNFVQSPVDFWNLKVKSYFSCEQKVENALVCYYENITQFPEAFLHSLRPYCEINDTLFVPTESTKGDNKTFKDYQKEAIAYDPIEELGEKIYNKILSRLDQETLRKTPYWQESGNLN